LKGLEWTLRLAIRNNPSGKPRAHSGKSGDLRGGSGIEVHLLTGGQRPPRPLRDRPLPGQRRRARLRQDRHGTRGVTGPQQPEPDPVTRHDQAEDGE